MSKEGKQLGNWDTNRGGRWQKHPSEAYNLYSRLVPEQTVKRNGSNVGTKS